MDKAMSEPIEQRMKTLELKVAFLENWKNTPFIQVTLPVILSIFLASSWDHSAFSSMEKRLDSMDKRFDSIESSIKELTVEVRSLDQRLSKIERKLGI